MKTIIIRDKDDNDNEILGVFLTDDDYMRVRIDKYRYQWSEIDDDISLIDYIKISLRSEGVSAIWLDSDIISV